ncbi:MAG: hypothetical protein FJ125_17430 [Deltaproteobacteria bacterium]|nr:hypothetical protein [Deltaproteobacteria bacterium]
MTKKRAKQKSVPGEKASSAGKGIMSGMRLGMKRVVGAAGTQGKTKPKSKAGRALDIALWVLVLGLLIFLLLKRFS